MTIFNYDTMRIFALYHLYSQWTAIEIPSSGRNVAYMQKEVEKFFQWI